MTLWPFSSFATQTDVKRLENQLKKYMITQAALLAQIQALQTLAEKINVEVVALKASVATAALVNDDIQSAVGELEATLVNIDNLNP